MVFIRRHHLIQARTQKYLPPTKREKHHRLQPVRMFSVTHPQGRDSERKPRGGEEG